jgi:hypothetical protein
MSVDQPGGRRWVAVAGTVAAVLAVGAGALVLSRAGEDAAPPGGGPAEVAAPRPDPAPLILREGDRVEADGIVVARPGKPVMFCPVLPTIAIGTAAGVPAPAPTCVAPLGVAVTGVDLARLSRPGTAQGGVRYGYGTLRGSWRHGAVAVTAQGPPSATDVDADIPDPAPPAGCTPPPGGWGPGDGGDPGPGTPDPYIQQHAAQLGAPWVVWPEGYPSGSTASPAYYDKVQVLVVPVVSGDVDRFRAELAATYPGNLCVLRAPAGMLSQQRTRDISAAISPLMGAGSRVYESGNDGTGRITVTFTYLDQELYDTFRRIGLTYLVLRPWLHPTER